MRSNNIRVALLHHTGGGNLGDDATLDVVVAEIRERWPDAQITALSMNPLDTMEKHGLPAYPLRRHTWGIGYGANQREKHTQARRGLGHWLQTTRNPIVRLPRSLYGEFAFLASSFFIIRKFDLMIVSGGGQLTERSGPWGFPYAIFVWTMLAKIAGVRRRFLNVGAGPLRHRISRYLVTRSLYAADYVSFRDEDSQLLANAIGFSGESQVFPDSAYCWSPLPSASSRRKRDKPVVGIAPMPFPFCDPREYPGDHQAIYEKLMQKFAKFTATLVEEGYAIELFGSDAGADPACVEDLRKILSSDYGIETPPHEPMHSVQGLLAQMADMDYVVTCRFHGTVFAHLLNKPILAISHHPKVATLMKSIGLSEFCVDIQTFDSADLAARFRRLVRNSEAVRRQLADRSSDFRRQLEKQYDELFPRADSSARYLFKGSKEQREPDVTRA
jgi:polysaccharide pyruvyl transferase WcaK-like protein